MTEFDRKAEEWDADPARVERARQVAEAIRQSIPLSPNMESLEYGCGTGLLSFALQRDLGPITLADSSPGMLAVLQRKIAASRAARMTPRKLDLAVDAPPTERFDLIYTLMTLHHMADTDAALRYFHTLLRPGGWLAICDLDTEDGSFHEPGFTGHRGFDRTTLAEKLGALGFTAMRTVTAYQVERETPGGSKLFPLFVAVGRRGQ